MHNQNKKVKGVIVKLENQYFANLVQLQCQFAIETENKVLSKQQVLKSLQFFIQQPGIGNYYLSKSEQDIVGCCMISYAYDLFQDKAVNWLQRAYIDKKYRKKGFFRQLFQKICEEHQKKVKGLRLLVKKTNQDAIDVYHKLGFKLSKDKYIVKYYNRSQIDKKSFKNQFLFKLYTVRYIQNENSKQSFMEFLQNKNNNYSIKQFDTIKNLNQEQESLLLVSELSGQLVGYFLFFIEFQDWEYKINLYFYNYQYNSNICKHKNFMNHLEYYILKQSGLQLDVNAIVFYLEKQQDDSMLKNNEIGLKSEEYYILKKNHTQFEKNI